MATWWGSRKQVSARLLVEVQTMHNAFESTFKLVVPRWGLLYWIGTVELNLLNLKTPAHELRIVYPQDYPRLPPAAYVLRPQIISPKHQYEDGQLCLFNPRDGREYGWNPARSTATTVAAWSLEWLYSFYTYRATGRWPGTEESVLNQKPRLPTWGQRRSG